MPERFSNPLSILICLVLFFSTVLLTANSGYSADTYTVPQTAEVTISWAPNDPTPEGYRIFQRAEGEAYDYSQPCWTGSDTQGTVYNLDWDTTYYFVVRAYEGDLESADSEEVSYSTTSSETKTYTITATAGNNGSISPSGSLTVADQADQAFTIAPDSGYSIADVLVDGVSQGAIASYAFSQTAADHTITVEFAVDTHWISASAGDHGDIVPVGDTEVAHGASQVFTIVPDDGYRVASVLVDGIDQGLLTSYTYENIDADHTITAEFAVSTHTITASAGDNGSVSPSGTAGLFHGGSATYTITPDSGYTIADVLVNNISQGAIASYTFSNVTADQSLQATFAADKGTVGNSEDQVSIVIDDGRAGTSSSGSWPVSGGRDPYGAQSLYSKSIGGTYTYETEITGAYDVEFWWTEYSSRCTSVPVEIYDGETLLETVYVNQQEDGGQWNFIGTYDFTGQAKVVIVSESSSCSTGADAILFSSKY